MLALGLVPQERVRGLRPNPIAPPFGGGGSGGSSGSGGGSGGGGSASGGGFFVPISNGGVFAQNKSAMYPAQDLVSGGFFYYTYDVTVPPDDPRAGSSYTWRSEQMMAFRNPTIRGIIWTFTDLGRVAVTWSLVGVNERFQVVTYNASLGVGNAVPTNQIMSVRLDFPVATFMNWQLSVNRLAGAGPLSIVKVTAFGDIEENSL